jgi:hypothetical protein
MGRVLVIGQIIEGVLGREIPGFHHEAAIEIGKRLTEAGFSFQPEI